MQLQLYPASFAAVKLHLHLRQFIFMTRASDMLLVLSFVGKLGSDHI